MFSHFFILFIYLFYLFIFYYYIWQFYPELQPFPVLQQDLTTTRTFLQQKKRFALYLTYAILVTYVPFFGAEQFQFPYRVTVSAQTGSNWFLFIIQTGKPLKKNCFTIKIFLIQYFFFFWCDNSYHAEGNTEIIISIQQSWKKLCLKILMRVTLKTFTEVAILAASGLLFWIKIMHVVNTKIFVWPSWIF